MELRIGKGLDGFLFGTTEAQIVKSLGAPNKIQIENDDRRLRFDGLRATFWFCEDHLHWIQCANPDLVIFGAKMVGLPADQVLKFAHETLREQSELDDYGLWESYSFPESELELQFEYGVLQQVCFGNLWDENDEPIWPDA